MKLNFPGIYSYYTVAILHSYLVFT